MPLLAPFTLKRWMCHYTVIASEVWIASKQQDFDNLYAHFEEKCDEMELVNCETQMGCQSKLNKLASTINIQMKICQ